MRRRPPHAKFSFKSKRRLVFGISLLILIVLYALKNTSFLVRGFSAISVLLVFYLADHLFTIHFRLRHYFYILFIAIAGFMLSPLYFIYPNYDKILHFVQPLMFSSVVFYMVSKLDLKLKWKLITTFFIVTSCLALFEIGEYVLDLAFDFKLQGVYLWDIKGINKFQLLMDRIDDTMVDLIIGNIAAGIYWFSTYLYLRKKHPY